MSGYVHRLDSGHIGKSRCDPDESGLPYGYNAEPIGQPCGLPCLGERYPDPSTSAALPPADDHPSRAAAGPQTTAPAEGWVACGAVRAGHVCHQPPGHDLPHRCGASPCQINWVGTTLFTTGQSYVSPDAHRAEVAQLITSRDEALKQAYRLARENDELKAALEHHHSQRYAVDDLKAALDHSYRECRASAEALRLSHEARDEFMERYMRLGEKQGALCDERDELAEKLSDADEVIERHREEILARDCRIQELEGDER